MFINIVPEDVQESSAHKDVSSGAAAVLRASITLKEKSKRVRSP